MLNSINTSSIETPAERAILVGLITQEQNERKAKEYIEEKNILNKEELSILLEEYEKINEIGIPFINFYSISMNIVKIVIYAFVSLV